MLAQSQDRIIIDAEQTRFDRERSATHLQGEVRIRRGELEINAAEGWGFRGEAGWQRIELNGHPVTWQTHTEDGGQTTGQSDELIYDPVARTVTMIGNALIEEERGRFSGQRLIYNIDTQATEGQGGIHMEVEADAVERQSPPPAEEDPAPAGEN